MPDQRSLRPRAKGGVTVKPLNAAQARILRTRINVAKAAICRMQNDLQRLRVLGFECHRMRAVGTALAGARSALEDGDDACMGVEIDEDAREPVTRLRFTPR